MLKTAELDDSSLVQDSRVVVHLLPAQFKQVARSIPRASFTVGLFVSKNPAFFSALDARESQVVVERMDRQVAAQIHDKLDWTSFNFFIEIFDDPFGKFTSIARRNQSFSVALRSVNISPEVELFK